MFTAGYDKPIAKIMGVQPHAKDYLLALLAGRYVTPQVLAHTIALYIPGLNKISDKNLIHHINKLLVEYGHAEYTTDVEKYKPAKTA